MNPVQWSMLTKVKHVLLNRRQAVTSTAALAATTVIPGHGLAGFAELPLPMLDPLRPLDSKYPLIRPGQFSEPAARNALERLWVAFQKTKRREYGEWAPFYCYNTWRLADLGKPRVEISRVGRKMAIEVLKHHPDSSWAAFWKGAFVGMETVSHGLLDAAHMVPGFRDQMVAIEAKDPTVYWGAPLIALAKIYIKAPAFPVSVGDIHKGMEYLDKLRPIQEKKFALWYLYLAEAELTLKGKDAAFAVLDKMEAECKPVDTASKFVLETTLIDAAEFRRKVSDGSYNRYKWDPVLTPLVDAR